MKTYRMLLAELGYADFDQDPADIAEGMGLSGDGHNWPPELQDADRYGLDAVVTDPSQSATK